jgi:hypothetical protein
VTAAVAAIALALAMPQPWGQLFRRDHILVVGTPGCGKTPFAAELVEGGPLAALVGLAGPAARRVVYFDPTGEWAHLGDVVQGENMRDAADGRDADLLAGTTLRLVVEPRDGTLVEDFTATVDACRAASHHGGLVLVVDEVGDLTDGGAADVLRGLHRNGHKDGIATLLCSPAWTDIPARCRSTRSRVFSFAQLAAADVETLNRELGRVVPDFGDKAASWQYPAPPIAWTSPTLHR